MYMIDGSLLLAQKDNVDFELDSGDKHQIDLSVPSSHCSPGKNFCQVKSSWWIWHPLGSRSRVQLQWQQESSPCLMSQHMWIQRVIQHCHHLMWTLTLITQHHQHFHGMYSSTLLKCQTNIMLFRWALSPWVVTMLNRHEWYLDLSTPNPSWHMQEQIQTFLWSWWI